MAHEIEDPFARSLAALRAHRVAFGNETHRQKYLEGLGFQVTTLPWTDDDTIDPNTDLTEP